MSSKLTYTSSAEGLRFLVHYAEKHPELGWDALIAYGIDRGWLKINPVR